ATDTVLFTQTAGFLVEVSPDHEKTFLSLAKKLGVSVHPVGKTTSKPALTVVRGANPLLEISLPDAQHVWRNALKDHLS
ncbi:hypothetical protein HYZ99_01110, partial [Candidatus Peregrinibacteria bacterium]|nr:hypothetical protein [Candidatus Peregrinibacteria bacterium]